MGGERASTVRQRECGKICAICHIPLDAPPWGSSKPRGYGAGERVCDRCRGTAAPQPSQPTRRVYFSFFQSNGWVIKFSPPSLDRVIGRCRKIATADAIRAMILRTPTQMDLASRQALEAALQNGRGGLFLELTPEQYRKIMR